MTYLNQPDLDAQIKVSKMNEWMDTDSHKIEICEDYLFSILKKDTSILHDKDIEERFRKSLMLNLYYCNEKGIWDYLSDNYYDYIKGIWDYLSDNYSDYIH